MADFGNSSDSDSPSGGGHEAKPPQKRLTVTFQDVAVRVNGLGQDYASTCASVVGDLFSLGRNHKSERNILQNITGQVRPGEMLLVLGRPGSGCTSLLKVISNHSEEFREVTGTVRYGNVGPKQAKHFRHQIVMNTEEDLHFPTLTVKNTLKFATSMKLPNSRPDHLQDTDDYISHMVGETLGSLAIGHTGDTVVGDEFVRGVSGGERKRVSLAEILATQAPLQCWDNSTRGLDASNALDFARVLRNVADTKSKTIVATFYQAGNSIYDLFDKVIVLAEGRSIYYGPTTEAKKYFEDMGFACPPGANVADFLTSVAVHTERRIVPGFETVVPNTASEFEDHYKESTAFRTMTRAIAETSETDLTLEVDSLHEIRKWEKRRNISFLSRELSPYLASFRQQVLACTASASIFRRPGAIFYPIMLWTMNKMSETTASFMGRPILTRHKRLALNRPAAYAIACLVTDVPLVTVLYTIFHVVFYFMVGFQHDAGKFFTAWFLYLLVTLCHTSLYRALGAWCKHFGLASQISGFVTMVMMVYAGYLIPVPSMHPWFQWISYINPASYAFEAVMASETGNRILECVGEQYVPYGGSYDGSEYRSCTVPGSQPGDNVINGASYIEFQYAASASHIWRNAGIIIGFWFFFAFLAAMGFEMNLHSSSGSVILFDQRSQQKQAPEQDDVEKAAAPSAPEMSDYLLTKQTVFTFKNINYFVHHEGKEKQLLRDVSGYVKPGQLVALMGASGAGKTTLMDALSQRKDSGRLEGSIMVNGKPQGITFQRDTGYCEQNDVHEPTATVWESLMFSARLRQSYSIPDTDKQQYVRRIMDLLELTPIQHAIVGSPGSGLSIEQRKRLTLATELVAKPSLLFLDEPTSGLDGQSAYEICRFMRKLAASGQTIICTIHQPSAALFEAFDVLLLLAKGGRTTYFGPTGEDSSIVLDYFAQRGAPCAPGQNPAEHIVDVVQGRSEAGVDWPQKWIDSEERRLAMDELEQLNNNSNAPLAVASGEEKAAITSQSAEPTAEDEALGDFATPVLYQIKLVTRRQMLALWRNPDYVWNKIGLHVTNSLFGGFTFWKIGNGTFDLQLRLMAVFNFVFVAPGCINQLQPLFIHNRNIFEVREKKSKAYHWLAFISAQLISEIPVLILCATIYFVCWYFTAGFPVKASVSGQVYLQMILYEFLYTAIGQAIAAYSPSEYFAALANPLIIGAALINFCGVVVPYSQIQPFWRYWLYYINPFTYLMGGLLEPVVWDVQVECSANELTTIPLPPNTTCEGYMGDFIKAKMGYLVNPESESTCSYCPYSTGADYMKTMNINESYYGWRDVGITALFCISSYALVFLMMKLRTKATKTAS
ncbi:hypothetical protein SLS62_010705 [Diatrype stigma]|uniref:ABC transporter domain-containing protein n=1 Tax=Diatrype stigma TaxID=117547 RepID=A0AAN9YFQ7_9PEZI